MTDINSRADIELLMSEFYNSLLQDDSISYIFTDVAKINLEEHLPVICDFWESILFQRGNYKKDVMNIHLQLSSKETLTKGHFECWLGHFNATIDRYYKGINADVIKMRAQSIATVMQLKLQS